MSKTQESVSNRCLICEPDALLGLSIRAMFEINCSDRGSKGFQGISSGEAARTRSVATRSLKECDIVTRDVAIKMLDEEKWS